MLKKQNITISGIISKLQEKKRKKIEGKKCQDLTLLL